MKNLISGLTKDYYITSSFQKISSIHQFIFEKKQILESQDLKGHSHIWPYVFLFFCFFVTAIWLPHGQLLGDSQGDSLTNLILITAFYLCQPEGQWEPHNEVGSLSPAERLAGFEPGTFWF